MAPSKLTSDPNPNPSRAGALVVVGNPPRPEFLAELMGEAGRPPASAGAPQPSGAAAGAPNPDPSPLSAVAAAAASGFRRSIAGEAAWLELLAGLVGGAGKAPRASRLALPGPGLNPKPAAAGTLAARGALAAHHLLADAASRRALLAHCAPGGGGGGGALLRALVQAAGVKDNKARSGLDLGLGPWCMLPAPRTTARLSFRVFNFQQSAVL